MQRSRPDEEMRLKANLSYGEVRSSGATKVNMDANHSYGLVRETMHALTWIREWSMITLTMNYCCSDIANRVS